ncbi:MAG: glycosyl hydrolase 53 family protein [Chitinispirillaceae bacterium]|nr:glycosyl hydrolase 53 family protein [Chitinispirillaceae bacterium]
MRNHLFLSLSLVCCMMVVALEARSRCFIFGADISGSHRSVQNGSTYSDDGERKTLLEILAKHGFNWIRLRMFVDPTVKVPEVPNESPYSTSGACDLEHTVDFAKYIKEAGFKFLLDFHYSDTWADPGKQWKPVSWRDLTYEELVEQVRTYTRESLEAFEAAGVLPDMVQVGNEVVGGMIWEDGRSRNMSKFAELVNAGIDGVKDVSEDIEIMIHSISENSPSDWLSNLIKAGVERIDVFGLSYYERWHGTPDDLERRVKEVAEEHDVLIALAEYSDNHRRVNDIIFNLPDEQGLGTFIWEPTGWGEALFSGGSTNERMDLYPEMREAYGNDTCSDKVGTSTDAARAGLVVSATTALPTVWFDGNRRVHFNNGLLSIDASIDFFTLQGRRAGKGTIGAAGIVDVASTGANAFQPYNGICVVRLPGGGGRSLVKINR